MNNWYENIEKIVAKIEGDKTGNAFLIDRNRAVTVKHCIQDTSAKVKLVFPKIQEGELIEVWATVDGQFNPEDDELLLLKLEKELPKIEISIAVMKIYPDDEVKVFGYDANYLALGRWTDFISAASVIPNTDIVQDMLFDAKYNQESDFAGLSGSPIIKKSYIIGIVSQETLEKSQAIGIHGISIKSCFEFWTRYDVRVTELTDIGEYSFDPDLSIGSYRDVSKNITIGGEQGIQGWLHGKYREKLEEIVLLHRRGDVDGAWSELKEQIMELERNPYVEGEVKAEYYYRMALWFLEDRNDIGKAQKKYEKAVEMKPDLDCCIFHSLKQVLTGECKDPEELLEPVDTVSKFNVYLQVCINARKKEKAYQKYEELVQVITMDDTTYYLLSIMETLRHEYDSAMKYIEEALRMNGKMPVYYSIKGIILYWKALPADICVEDDFYPVMFNNGILHLDEEQRQMLVEAGAACRKAFQLANTVEDKGLVETVLSLWINSLSVDSSFQNDVMEPLHLLLEINPFNVTALLYMIQKKMKLPEKVTVESLERYLKKSQNKIGYVIVLIELCISQNDLRSAKKFLHEYQSLFFKGEYYDYWYEFIVKVEENEEKLKEYEYGIINNAELEEIRKKRLLCLFWQLDSEKDTELWESLCDIYKQTDRRLDLLNLIYFCTSRRKWLDLLRYAERLFEQYNDSFGKVYKIQSLVELGEYDTAMNAIVELQENQIVGTEAVILHYEIVIHERQGRYAEAIDAGRKLLKVNPSEQLFLKLSSLFLLDGDDENALNILLRAEEYGIVTVAVCQKISISYLVMDQRKAWEYAVKAVKLSENQPEVMLWAATIANRVGRSDKAGEYFHQLMSNKQDRQLLMTKSIDEVVELLRKSKEQTEKNIEMLCKGKLPSHLFVDSYQGNQTYAEIFYALWDNKNIAPMEFGAHQYEDSQLRLDKKKIALDYSACLFLHEINLLECFCDGLQQIYVAGDLFGIISEEIRKIPVNQSDFICARYQMFEKCKTELNVCFVECKFPAGLEEMEVKRRSDVIHAYTAEVYEAVWVSVDGAENSIREIEVITALYRDGKIPRETFEAYSANVMPVREEKIRNLYQKHMRLLVDETVLKNWDKFYLLPAVCESFDVMAEREVAESAVQDYESIAIKEHICERLVSLKKVLLDLKDQGKLTYLPMEEYHDGMMYSNMLISLMTAAGKRNLPMCIDDRVITSYSCIDKSPIYNTFDLMRMLYLEKKISLEKYCSLWKKALDKRISYVLPDNHFVLYALKLSEVDLEAYRLNESEMLLAIRKYVVTALSQDSYLSHEKAEHVHIPEWEYFVFYLQLHSRDLLRSVWQSDMEYGKMRLASDWILCHYSQFAFDFSGAMNEKRRKECHAIQLADFLLEGLLMAIDEKLTKQYYKWLYGWLETYLEINPGIKIKTLRYTQEYIVSYLRKIKHEGNKQEIRLTQWMFATGIYYMPEEYKVCILDDNMISNMYNSIYSQISVVLNSAIHIPIALYRTWEKEILIMDEKEILIKNYKDYSFQFSWEYILPAFPGVNIAWEENSVKKIRRMFMDRGCRLKHEDRNVRKRELRYIEPYLEEFDYGRQNLSLHSMGQYEIAAEEILCLLDMSEKYEDIRIECGLKKEWFLDRDTRKLMLPFQPDYFKQLYDFDVNPDISTVTKSDASLALPLHFGEIENEPQVGNHNPVRLLHRLAWLLSADAIEKEIFAVVEALFSYVNEGERGYGYAFIVLLKAVWHLFMELGNYKNVSYENRLVWSYLWTDKILTCLVKLEKENYLDVVVFAKQLEENAGLDIKIDGLWDITENVDILSPVHMNLFKLCVTGTLKICSCYESRMNQLAQGIMDSFRTYHNQWISTPIYYREAVLLHKREKNYFDAIFSENYNLLIEKLAKLGNCEDEICINMSCGEVNNMRMGFLEGILDGKGVGMPELIYLFVISRENLEETYANMIKEIIEKQVLGKTFQAEIIRYRLLAYIVKELPEDFQDEYLKHELTRAGALLQAGEMLWKDVYNLVLEMIQVSDCEYFFTFWEKYADVLKGIEALQMAERMGRLQLKMPLVYAEKTRNLRMRFELQS